jgi:hypothetical protein
VAERQVSLLLVALAHLGKVITVARLLPVPAKQELGAAVVAQVPLA